MRRIQQREIDMDRSQSHDGEETATRRFSSRGSTQQVSLSFALVVTWNNLKKRGMHAARARNRLCYPSFLPSRPLSLARSFTLPLSRSLRLSLAITAAQRSFHRSRSVAKEKPLRRSRMLSTTRRGAVRCGASCV